MRIFWLFNHPAPYKVEFFNRLGELTDLTVYFERPKEGGRNDTFYSAEFRTFKGYVGKPVPLGKVNSYSHEAIDVFKKGEYDLVVINGWRTWTERAFIRHCRRNKIPYVFYVNGGIIRPNENNLAYLLKKGYIEGADHYMAPDPVSMDYLVHYGAKKEDVFLYPYGSVAESDVLPVPYDTKAVQKIRGKVGIEEEKAFVAAGFFVKRKGFDTLIRLWTRMPQGYGLYLVGEGRERKSLMRLARKEKLDNVHILPYMDHDKLFRFYRACDGFLFPTHEDIYGHVVTEALSQGLPVFASSYSNAAKLLIQDNENGAIVDFDNPEEVVALLTREGNEAMKPKALATARRYTYEESAKAHLEFFSSILEGDKE